MVFAGHRTGKELIRSVRTFLLFSFFLAFIFQSFDAAACTCPPLEKISKEQTDAYSAIFVAKIDSVSACEGELSKAYVTVSRLYKGDITQHITVNFDCATDCRMQLKTGEQWLFYARYVKFGDLRIDFCSRSRKYSADVNEDYAVAINGMTWDEEVRFLKDTYGEQTAGDDKEVINPDLMNRELVKPQGMQIVWLLAGSLAAMGIIWLLFRKFWK